METVNDRMEMIVNERFNGNKAAFAKAIQLTPTSISSYLGNKRRSKPSIDLAARIVRNLGVNARWLLTGEGEAYTDGTERVQQAVQTVQTAGDYSPASYHGDVTVGSEAVLAERVKALESEIQARDRLLTEKERLIQVLMEKR